MKMLGNKHHFKLVWLKGMQLKPFFSELNHVTNRGLVFKNQGFLFKLFTLEMAFLYFSKIILVGIKS